MSRITDSIYYIYIYEKLLKAGVDARLKVWEGMCTRFA